MSIDLLSVQQLAEQLARRVGEELASEHCSRNLEIEFKGADDLVTKWDRWSEEQIRSSVARHFPSHTVVGEEGAYGKPAPELRSILNNAAVCWVIDPIDGTTNFVNGIPYFAVSIGVLVHGTSQVGVIYDPSRNELFSARRGCGATLNGSSIAVCDSVLLEHAVVATCAPRVTEDCYEKARVIFHRVADETRSLRNFGSAAIEQCWVACGRLNAYYEFQLKPWDVAAGSLIVEEAGGVARNSVTQAEDTCFSVSADCFLFSSRGIAEELATLLTRQ